MAVTKRKRAHKTSNGEVGTTKTKLTPVQKILMGPDKGAASMGHLKASRLKAGLQHTEYKPGRAPRRSKREQFDNPLS